jgi:oligoendopeptidase F
MKEKKINISVNEEDVQNLINCYEKDIEYIKKLEKENEELKSVIDDIKHILNNQMDYREFVDIVNDIEEILERVRL